MCLTDIQRGEKTPFQDYVNGYCWQNGMVDANDGTTDELMMALICKILLSLLILSHLYFLILKINTIIILMRRLRRHVRPYLLVVEYLTTIVDISSTRR